MILESEVKCLAISVIDLNVNNKSFSNEYTYTVTPILKGLVLFNAACLSNSLVFSVCFFPKNELFSFCLFRLIAILVSLE